MPKTETQHKKFDIQKRQQHVFDAAVENVKQANEAIEASQNWLLLLSLAELSLIGSLLLTDTLVVNLYLLKGLAAVLLVAFVFFIIASITQYWHLRNQARMYNKISNDILERYLNKGVRLVNKIPEELELPRQIVTNKLTNYLFLASYLLVVFVTIGIAYVVFKI